MEDPSQFQCSKRKTPSPPAKGEGATPVPAGKRPRSKASGVDSGEVGEGEEGAAEEGEPSEAPSGRRRGRGGGRSNGGRGITGRVGLPRFLCWAEKACMGAENVLESWTGQTLKKAGSDLARAYGSVDQKLIKASGYTLTGSDLTLKRRLAALKDKLDVADKLQQMHEELKLRGNHVAAVAKVAEINASETTRELLQTLKLPKDVLNSYYSVQCHALYQKGAYEAGHLVSLFAACSHGRAASATSCSDQFETQCTTHVARHMLALRPLLSCLTTFVLAPWVHIDRSTPSCLRGTGRRKVRKGLDEQGCTMAQGDKGSK